MKFSLPQMIEKYSGIIAILLIIAAALMTSAVVFKAARDGRITYEAEQLPGKIGAIQSDGNASSGLVRYATFNESGDLVFGPYVKIPPGDYEVTYRIRPEGNNISEPVGFVDVFSSNRKLSEASIRYLSLTLQFRSDGQNLTEFRVYKFPLGELSADSITVVPTTITVIHVLIRFFLPVIVFIGVGFLLFIVFYHYRDKVENFISSRIVMHVRPEYILFSLIFIFYFLVILGCFHPLAPISGDEPHYLTATNSIIHDRDIDLKNDYENWGKLSFQPELPIQLENQYSHVAVNPAGEWIPVHEIGFSLLLVVPFALSGVEGAQIFLALIVSLVVVQTYLLIKDILHDKRIAFLASLLAGIVSPLVFYSHSLYPEPVAALIFVYSTRILYVTYTGRAVNRLSYLVMAAGLAFLPWLGIKYASLMVPLLLVSVYCLWTAKRNLIIATLPVLCSSIIYLSFLYLVFGTISPEVRYSGVGDLKAGPSLAFSYLLMPAHLMSYFFGQRAGLFMYAPLFVLAIVGLLYFLLKARSKRDLEFLAIILLPAVCYFFTYAASGTYGGWAPPTRTLVAISPLIILLFSYGILIFFRHGLRMTVVLLSLISIGISFWLLSFPTRLFSEDLRSMLLRKIAGNIFIDFSSVFPLFPQNNLGSWLSFAFWTGIFCLIVMGEYLYRRSKTET